MKLKKKIFAIVICTIFVSVFTLGTFATSLNSGNLHLTEQPIRNYSKYMPSDLSDQTVENICNYVNGDTYIEDEWIEEIRHCGTVASLHINYHYNQAYKKRTEIPQYLLEAYNKINSRSLATFSLESNYSITSDTGRFIIQYDSATGSNRIALANLLATIFDGADMYLCGFYGFDRPTTTGTAYIVKLVSDSIIGYGTNGVTYAVDSSTPSLTYIEIRESLVNDFYNDADSSFVLGVAIHEYWHAILYEYGITSESSHEAKWFHESTGRAIGIEYELEYANNAMICSSISNFVSSSNFSFGSQDSIISHQHYGAALFELVLFEDYDEWYTLANVLNNFDSTKGIMENIDLTLQRYYNSNLDDMYTTFRLYNVTPDMSYLTSPYNRMNGEGNNTWGTPSAYNTHNIYNTSSSFSGSGSVNYLSVKYIKITAESSSSKTVYITVTTGVSNGAPSPRVAYAIKPYNANYYIHAEPNMVGGSQSTYSLDMGLGTTDEIYIVICNAGTSGTMTYSYNITMSS